MKKGLLLILGVCISVSACSMPGRTSPTVPQIPSPTAQPAPSMTVLPTVTQSPVPTRPPTQAATAKPMEIPTRAATPTRKPSRTPTISSTPSPWPTETPLVPTPLAGVQYRLTDWTPEKADQLISELIAYPDGLSNRERGQYDAGYYYAYQYAAFIQAESAMRYPRADQVEKWKWGNLYHTTLARGEVGEISSKLILEALNNRRITIDDLKTWFEDHDPQLSLELIPLTPLPGYTSSHIIALKLGEKPAEDDYYSIGGGTYLWLLQKSGVYSAYSLAGITDFAMLGVATSLDLVDLTGDNIPEAIIHHVDWGSFSMQMGSLDIFDLSQVPPQKLSFNPEPWDIDIGKWETLDEGTQPVAISFQIPIDITSGGCGLFGPTWDFRWDGVNFKLFRIQPPSINEMNDNPQCADVMISWILMHYASQGVSPANTLLAELIDSYPFVTDKQFHKYGNLHPDELRYQLGLSLAYLGNVIKAREQMSDIINSTIFTTSQWTLPARQFLDTYQSEEDFLEACETTHACYPFIGVETLSSLIPIDKYSDSLSILQASGLTMTESGGYDFDQDGIEEYWFVKKFQYSYDEDYTFWIIAKNSTQVYSQRVYTPYKEDPDITEVSLQPVSRINNEPVHQFQTAEQTFPFIWHYESATQQWVVIPIYEYFQQEIASCEYELLAGSNAQNIRDRLITLHEAHIHSDSPWLDYLIGLANEFIGDRKSAAATYLHLWQTYPNSPYAIMAKAKLEPVP